MTQDSWGSGDATWGSQERGGGASHEWGTATPPTTDPTTDPDTEGRFTGGPAAEGEYAGVPTTLGEFRGVPAAQTELANTSPTKLRHLAPLVMALAAVVVLAVAGWVVLGMQGGDDAAEEAAGAVTSSAESGDSSTAESTTSTSEEHTSASSEPSAQSILAVADRCTLDAVHSDPSLRSMDRILECDGEWMVAGKNFTDDVRLLRWDGDLWAAIPKTGTSRTSGVSCHRRDVVERAGVPEVMKSRVTVCRPADEKASETRYSGSVACDGRYIVIVESILVRPGEDADAKVGAALDRKPGASAMNPGLCPSLVEEYNGADVFPIYYDYGFSRSAACDAAKRSKGKAAVLSTQSDTSSPCQ